ncbi:uncharacterized protein RCO7_11640 [Rhynchosporium graminicola]|uniref:ABC-type Fe3+ transport system, periplasmic component n=1 Tax=Rhynchosporium graminicola TaxID=2792576 RepID=A0A1E1LJS4_9HELO|nr:uncharacterized protein RCO7_11640 [Rhynchosporium commune]
MSLFRILSVAATVASLITAFDPQLGFNSFVEVETRSLDELHEAALKEGGLVTLWAGGDEKNKQDGLKTAFESRFPGMTLNVTVDVSKYHDGSLDQQIATDSVIVDNIVLQTLNDFPGWKIQGALLPYKPQGFDQVINDFKDVNGFYTAVAIYTWSNTFAPAYLKSSPPVEYTDFLKPEFKDKLVLTYPNDDDAILYQFALIMNQYGYGWFEALLTQNPRWVRGSSTPGNLISSSNRTYTATFGGSAAISPGSGLNISYPIQGQFVSWPQTGAILKNPPHPNSAKLLQNFYLSAQRQNNTWSVRNDMAPPKGYPMIMDMPGTDPTKFSEWMADRAAVERLRFFF